MSGHLAEKHIGVTGASGFIGRQLCIALKAQGAHVYALGRQRMDGPWDGFVQVDLTQVVPDGVLENIDIVFHLAGKAHALSETRQDEDEYFRINVEGTRRLLEGVKKAGVRRFVFFSSIKAMGEGGEECLDESVPCHPETPYGKSKLEAEGLVLQGGYVSEPVVLRLSMVYGSTRKGNLPRMIEAIVKGRFPPLPEVGNRRSMVHVDDVVQAGILAAEREGAIGQTYIVTDGEAYSTRQIYVMICEALHKSVPVWSIPSFVLSLIAKLGDVIGLLRGRRFSFDSDALEKLVGSACYSSAKLERDLQFRAKHNLSDALPEIVRFLR